MSGVFSVLSDAQAGMFRLQQAKKPWEKEIAAKDAKGQLAEKAAQAARSFQLTPEQLRGHASAKAALEEARRVGGPKAAAEQRLEQVERKIEELKLAMRYAQGNPQKLAQLARQAAQLAREAGRAAKEYAVGVSNAAEMGLPGGAGAIGSTEITRTTTVTTLTMRQTEVSVSLTVKSGVDAAATDAAAVSGGEAAATALAAGLQSGEAAAQAPTPGEGEGAVPPELARMIDGALSGLRGAGGIASATGGTGGNDAHAQIQRMMADNDMKMSRYKEADGFGRRVEGVLHVAKRAIGEAKVANELDESEKRRKARREAFKADDKMVDAAQKEVNALRQAAFGSSTDVTDGLGASEDPAVGEDAGGAALGGGDAPSPGTAAPPAADASAVNVLA